MAMRRDVRLRKEFLFKKQKEALGLIRDDKKRKIKNSLTENKPIPTELIRESRTLHHELEMDINPLGTSDADKTQSYEKNWYDDEYANIGVQEPKICITTSRDPSSRLKQFAK
jgi:U3 small nucleolar ribonucleoprotein protein IMP4